MPALAGWSSKPASRSQFEQGFPGVIFLVHFVNEAVYNAVQTLNGAAGLRPWMGLAVPEASNSGCLRCLVPKCQGFSNTSQIIEKQRLAGQHVE
jgi:hypothetical protein